MEAFAGLKKIKRILCVVLLIGLPLSISAPNSYAGTSHSAITNESIKQKQDQISQSQQLKKQLQANINSAKAKKKELGGLKSDVLNYIQKVDAELSAIQEKIEEYNRLIAEKQAEIEKTTEELNEAIEVENTQYEAMKNRIRFMYKKGDSMYLEIMLSATSFSDFLTKADYIEKLEAYDRGKLDEYRAVREWTELVKATLESEKEVLDEVQNAQKIEEANLQELLDEKNAQLNEYTRQIANKTAEIDDEEAELQAQTAVIEALEAQILEEQKAIAAANGIILTYDGGKFTFPAPSYIKVTDHFGWRTDPISGRSSYHSGVDLGAPGGSKILAAYDGVVVAAAYDWSMGNYIMINHGDGLYTIYMHASALHVKKDDIVARGEHIANVGTTGRSTGNHLHFGVRLNGAYVDPGPYIGVN